MQSPSPLGSHTLLEHVLVGKEGGAGSCEGVEALLLGLPVDVLTHLCLRYLSSTDVLRLRCVCLTLRQRIPVAVAQSKGDPFWLCVKGHLDALRLAPLSVTRVHRSNLLAAACGAGHVDVAQWLVDHFQLTTEDGRAGDNYALRKACANGCLGAAQWLASRFGLWRADAIAWGNYALRMACARGHVDVVVWLVTGLHLTRDDAAADACQGLRTACLGGHHTVVRWLVGRFHFQLTDMPPDDRVQCANSWAKAMELPYHEE